MVENYEPIAWAEELIEPARAVDHPRLASLYVMASLCWMAGRIEAAVALQRGRPDGFRAGCDEPPYGFEGLLGGVYQAHRPARTGGRVVPRPARTRSRHRSLTRACLVLALMIAGSREEAMAAANGLIDAAEATHNPYALSFALSPTASPSATPIPTARLMPCAGAW